MNLHRCWTTFLYLHLCVYWVYAFKMYAQNNNGNAIFLNNLYIQNMYYNTAYIIYLCFIFSYSNCSFTTNIQRLALQFAGIDACRRWITLPHFCEITQGSTRQICLFTYCRPRKITMFLSFRSLLVRDLYYPWQILFVYFASWWEQAIAPNII